MSGRPLSAKLTRRIMRDKRLESGERRIYGYIPCPICWKRARKELLREANRHTRKRLSAT